MMSVATSTPSRAFTAATPAAPPRRRSPAAPAATVRGCGDGLSRHPWSARRIAGLERPPASTLTSGRLPQLGSEPAVRSLQLGDPFGLALAGPPAGRELRDQRAEDIVASFMRGSCCRSEDGNPRRGTGRLPGLSPPRQPSAVYSSGDEQHQHFVTQHVEHGSEVGGAAMFTTPRTAATTATNAASSDPSRSLISTIPTALSR